MTREEKTEEQLKVLVLNFAKGYVKDGDMDKEVEAMKWAESFIEKRIAEKVLEGKIDALESFRDGLFIGELYHIRINNQIDNIAEELSKLRDNS